MSIKLRKAANCLVLEIEHRDILNDLGMFKRDTLKYILGGVKNALDEPIRNCEVGTVEEQEDRFEKFCNTHKYVGDEGANVCSRDCPCYNGMDCGIRWAQMPYEESGK